MTICLNFSRWSWTKHLQSQYRNTKFVKTSKTFHFPLTWIPHSLLIPTFQVSISMLCRLLKEWHLATQEIKTLPFRCSVQTFLIICSELLNKTILLLMPTMVPLYHAFLLVVDPLILLLNWSSSNLHRCCSKHGTNWTTSTQCKPIRTSH